MKTADPSFVKSPVARDGPFPFPSSHAARRWFEGVSWSSRPARGCEARRASSRRSTLLPSGAGGLTVSGGASTKRGG